MASSAVLPLLASSRSALFTIMHPNSSVLEDAPSGM